MTSGVYIVSDNDLTMISNIEFRLQRPASLVCSVVQEMFLVSVNCYEKGNGFCRMYVYLYLHTVAADLWRLSVSVVNC